MGCIHTTQNTQSTQTAPQLNIVKIDDTVVVLKHINMVKLNDDTTVTVWFRDMNKVCNGGLYLYLYIVDHFTLENIYHLNNCFLVLDNICYVKKIASNVKVYFRWDNSVDIPHTICYEELVERLGRM